MYRLKNRAVLASEIAAYLNQDLVGDDFPVAGPDALRTPRSIARSEAERHSSIAHSEAERRSSIARSETTSEAERRSSMGRGLPDLGDQPILLITDTAPTSQDRRPPAGYIVSARPEVDLTYILLEFFSIAPIHHLHPKAHIDPEARLGRNVMVGAGSVIGPEVEIGDHSVILNHVVLSGRVLVGKHCFIKDGAVVGSEGYGFVQDEAGVPIHPPHLGRIVLGDRVWIGAHSTIERALLEDTVLGDDVKIDDLVHVGNGTAVGRRSMLTAGVVVAYGVTIGQDVKLGPHASVRELLRIADRVIVGQGAVVISDLGEGGVYVGNPARPLESAHH